MEESTESRPELEHPVTGWNPVPGRPDSVVWWDGTAFTHEAVRSGDGWSIVDRAGGTPERPTAVRPVGTGGLTVRTRANLAIAIGLVGVASVFVVLALGVVLLFVSLTLAVATLERANAAGPADHRRVVLAVALATMELVAVGLALLLVMVATNL